MVAAAAGAAVSTATQSYRHRLSPTAGASGAVTVLVDVTLGTQVVTGKYADQHAAAYRIVQAIEQGDYTAVHSQAFADVFKAGV